MLSRGAMGCSHCGHRDGGDQIRSPETRRREVREAQGIGHLQRQSAGEFRGDGHGVLGAPVLRIGKDAGHAQVVHGQADRHEVAARGAAGRAREGARGLVPASHGVLQMLGEPLVSHVAQRV